MAAKTRHFLSILEKLLGGEIISIRRKRTEANMTQAELAKALGVNQSAVTQWESGLTSPRLDKLQAMAALFKCTLDELVGKDVGNEIPADLMDGE